MMLAVRCKAGGLFRNTVLWRLCARVCRFFREVAANWSVIRRPVLTFLLYLLMTVITIPTVVLVPVWQGDLRNRITHQPDPEIPLGTSQ